MLNGERQAQLDGFKSRPLHGAEPRTIRHLHAIECGAIRAAEGHAHPPLKVSKPYTRRRALHEQLTFAEVRLAQPGSISYLEICPQRPLLMMKPLIQHEAILAVEVAGLNFRDVLNVLGMDPTGKVRPIGGESTGLVSVSGPLSVHVQPSNPVYGLVPGSLRAFAQCDAQYICQMPHVLQFDQAVTLPVIWVTARYCVAEAQLRSGQSVLVHAASALVVSVSCRFNAAGTSVLLCKQLAAQSSSTVFSTHMAFPQPVLGRLLRVQPTCRRSCTVAACTP